MENVEDSELALDAVKRDMLINMKEGKEEQEEGPGEELEERKKKKEEEKKEEPVGELEPVIDEPTLPDGHHAVFRLACDDEDQHVFYPTYVERQYEFTDDDGTKDNYGGLEAWLDKYRPSHIKRCTSYGVMLHVGRIHSIQTEKAVRNARCAEAWDALQDRENEINLSMITDKAWELGLESGYWMIHIPRESRVLDRTWRLICRAVYEGLLGKYTVARLIVYFRYPTEHNFFLLTVHNKDYTDEVEVKAIEGTLRKIGIRRNMRYKPAIMSHFKVYRDNKIDLIPSIYRSNWNRELGRSVITSTHTEATSEQDE